MDANTSFTNPQLTSENLDRYYVRSSILKAILKATPRFHGKFLDVGCGQMPYRDMITDRSKVSEYMGMDLGNNIYADRLAPDLIWDGVSIPLQDRTINCAMATEVLEHCPDPQTVMDEVFRVLKPRGTFFFTVPFLWPLHDAPYDEYRYTSFALHRIFSKAGFINIEVNALGGWDASLAQMLGLWVNRRPFGKRKRKVLRVLVKPIIKFLIGRDYKPEPMSGPMVTGWYGFMTKP